MVISLFWEPYYFNISFICSYKTLFCTDYAQIEFNGLRISWETVAFTRVNNSFCFVVLLNYTVFVTFTIYNMIVFYSSSIKAVLFIWKKFSSFPSILYIFLGSKFIVVKSWILDTSWEMDAPSCETISNCLNIGLLKSVLFEFY